MQPHLQNFVDEGEGPILKHQEIPWEVSDSPTQTVSLPSPQVIPTFENRLSEESGTATDLSDMSSPIFAYSPPGLSEWIHGPARPDTAFGILPSIDTVSLMSQGTGSTLCSVALSESDTLRSGISEQEVYLLQWRGRTFDFDEAESWADDLSDLVFETQGDRSIVVMQPPDEDDEEALLLRILLDDEEEEPEVENPFAD